MAEYKRCRLLIVEDEPIVAINLQSIFEAEGHVVIGPAASVPEALELIHSARVDYALLDVNLRGEKVFPIADCLAASSKPYIFVTGHGAEVIPQAHRDALVVTKPYSEAELIRAVNAFRKVTA